MIELETNNKVELETVCLGTVIIIFAPKKKKLRMLVTDISVVLVSAFEKALLYFDGCELPINWNREELLGPEEDDGDDGDEVSCGAQMKRQFFLLALSGTYRA